MFLLLMYRFQLQAAHVKLIHINRSAHSVTAHCLLRLQPVVCCCVGVG